MFALPAKNLTQIPRVSGTIDRSRLHDKIQSVLGHKLTIISAPPGFGKTTLAAHFAYQTQHPVVWHTIEERERDVPYLHTQCLASFSHIVPNIEMVIPQKGYSSSELAGLVTNHLRENLSFDIVWILDDVQHIAGSPGAETWLQTIVSTLPKTCHLILISRILPDLPLTEMIARREVMAIGQRDLQFTPEEIHQLARELLDAERSVQAFYEIANQLEGWPAGVTLALQPLPADLEHVMLNGGTGPEALFDALAGLMLQAQTNRLRSFLLSSSTLRVLTPELCSVVLQLPNSGYWLEEIQNRNLFLSKVAGRLVYHTLFRRFLQEQLQTANPDLFLSLHLRAARWFEQQNNLEEAFSHYMQAEETRYAAQITERVASSYFAQGKTETLLSWGNQLEKFAVHPPKLLLTCAMIHTDRYEYETASHELLNAHGHFEHQNDTEGLTSVMLQQAMIDLQQGSYKGALARARRLIQTVGNQINLRARTLNIMGIAQFRLGETEAAIQTLEQAVPLYRTDGDSYGLSQLLQSLDVAYTRVGRLDDAGACLQEVVSLRRALKSPGALALALNNLGYHYHLRSYYQQSISTFEEGLTIAAKAPDRRTEGYLLWSLGDLQRDQGNFDEALRSYNQGLERIGGSEPALRCSILISTSILLRWQSRFQDALAAAEEAIQLAEIYNLKPEHTFAFAIMWAARLHLGANLNSAKEHLYEACHSLHHQRAQLELVRVLAVQIQLDLKLADTAAAAAHLQQVQHITTKIGSAQPFISEVFYNPTLYDFVEHHLPKKDRILEDLNALQKVSVKSSHISKRLIKNLPLETYSLRVLTLGQERIERDGELIPQSKWRATAAKEMFLYLLFVGPQNREEFSLAFWPDSSTKQVRSNFHTTLYRARHALGENAIIFHEGRYMINPELDLRSDAHEFQTMTDEARLLPARDVRTEDLWGRAVDLYHGDFLPSVDFEWIIPLRESFRERYITALIGLSNCTQVRGDFGQALDILKQALTIDPYREDIHRSIMVCYSQRGEKQKIQMHLASLHELFWNELAMKPSSETIALAQTLLI